MMITARSTKQLEAQNNLLLVFQHEANLRILHSKGTAPKSNGCFMSYNITSHLKEGDNLRWCVSKKAQIVVSSLFWI